MSDNSSTKNPRSEWIKLRSSPDEKAGFERAAQIAGLSLSGWIRQRVRAAAVRELEVAGEIAPFVRPIRERRDASD